ncbi:MULTISPECIES: hypothetical protein [unclassified Streptomyces]
MEIDCKYPGGITTGPFYSAEDLALLPVRPAAGGVVSAAPVR